MKLITSSRPLMAALMSSAVLTIFVAVAGSSVAVAQPARTEAAAARDNTLNRVAFEGNSRLKGDFLVEQMQSRAPPTIRRLSTPMSRKLRISTAAPVTGSLR